jgi:hypothetical protein
MAYKNRYFKNPVGINSNFSFMAITKQVEYSDSADFEAFVTEAVEGEIGVFNAATGALISGAGNVSTTLPIFFAVKTGLGVKKSEAFRVADAKMTRTPYVAPVKGTSTFVFTGATIATGDEIGFKVMDLTIAGNPVTTFDFWYKAKAGDTFDTAMAALTAKINDLTSVELRDRDAAVSAAYTSGTDTIVFTNLNFGAVIKVLPQYKLTEKLVSSSTVKTVLGSGFEDEAKLWEEAINIKDGVTTNYPSTPMTQAESFGKPSSQVVAGGQYNHYTFSLVAEDTAKTVKKIDQYPNCMELLVASNGAANAEAEIKLIFGL